MPNRAQKIDCPRCGSTNVLEIVYGLPQDPSAEGAEAARREGVVFGGCCIGPDSPTHECADCEHCWEGSRWDGA